MKKSTEGQGTRVEFMPARDSFIHSFMQAPLRPPLRLVPTTPWRVWGS